MNFFLFLIQVLIGVLLLLILISIIPYTFHFIVKFSIGKDKRKIVKWKNRRDRLLSLIGIEKHKKTKLNYFSLEEIAKEMYWDMRHMPNVDDKKVSEYIFQKLDNIATYYYQKGKNSVKSSNTTLDKE